MLKNHTFCPLRLLHLEKSQNSKLQTEHIIDGLSDQFLSVSLVWGLVKNI